MGNLAICLPKETCNKHCPYCVSAMTWSPEINFSRMLQNIEKVRKVAAKAESVLLTGKGEPLLADKLPLLYTILQRFNDFPCELQTNGCYLKQLTEASQEALLSGLYERGLNTIAFSFDKLRDFIDLDTTMFLAQNVGLNVRVTLNITDMLPANLSWDLLVDLCGSLVDQLSLRKIVVPRGEEGTHQALWIKKHDASGLYDSLRQNIVSSGGRRVRSLPYGAAIYDLKGLSVAAFDYCVQDTSSEANLRSWIFQQDGHLYTTWNSPASRLF